MTKWKRGSLRVGLASLSVLLGLGLAELGVRVARSKPWYDRVGPEQNLKDLPRQTVGGFKVVLRAPLPTLPKAEGAFRILFLGDSFTYGLGVENVEETFVSRVVTRLNAEQPAPGRREYEAFNGGIPGSLTDSWVRLYGHAVESFAPDLVVGVFFLRDGTPNVESIPLLLKVRDRMNALVDQSVLFRHSHLYRLLRERRAQLEFSQAYLREINDAYIGDADQTSEWVRARTNLKLIQSESGRRGTDFAVVIFPILFQLTGEYPLQSTMDEIERFCTEAGIPSHSLLPVFANQNETELWVSPLDQHPNARGHEIAAGPVYDFIVERLRSPE